MFLNIKLNGEYLNPIGLSRITLSAVNVSGVSGTISDGDSIVLTEEDMFPDYFFGFQTILFQIIMLWSVANEQTEYSLQDSGHSIMNEEGSLAI